MKSWVIDRINDLSVERTPLRLAEMPVPEPAVGQVLLKVKVCGICHTEIDEIEGRTPPSFYPVIPGHQVIGTMLQHRGSRNNLQLGDRAGVAWIYSSCGVCGFCLNGQENLCSKFRATGRDAHGGYAEYMVVHEDYVYKIPDIFTDSEAAPLLCAGAIGYRSLSLCNMRDGNNLGLTGFGASAHLVVKLAQYTYPRSAIYVFARSREEREFAMQLGCRWAGDTADKSPVELDCIIDTTPVWSAMVEALANLKPGGRLVINAIRKEGTDKEYLQKINYPVHLWMEKEIKSVANVTRRDVEGFINLAASMPFKPEVEEYPFDSANQAILDIRNRRIKGAKVLNVGK